MKNPATMSTSAEIGNEKEADHAALTALSGADYVRDKLLSTLTMGAFDFSRRVYAIKCRVKSKSKLIEKVRKRREKKPYEASQVTDIVGLRLICLFSMDLPKTVSDFLDYIAFMQDPRLGLFRGDKLEEAITEAIVYASPSDPVVYRSIYEALAGRLQKGADGGVNCEMVPPSEEFPYSSIHLICMTNSFYSDSPRQIPIEVQIRTAFEDVWSEIDHPRRYKGPDFATMFANDPRLGGLADGIGRRLKDLKVQLESCSSSAEQIRKDFDLLSPTPPQLQAASDANPRILARSWADPKAPEAIKRKLREIEESLTGTYGRLYQNDIVNPTADFPAIRRELEAAIAAIGDVGEKYKTTAPAAFAKDKTYKYYSHMEGGMAYYWLGRIDRDDGMAGWSGLIDAALKTYFDLQASLDKTDPLLSYRIANALKAQDQLELATDKLQEAVASLEDDKRLASDSVYRAIIPRVLGYMLWQRGQRLVKMGKSLGHPGSFGIQARSLFQQAIQVTLKGKKNIGALKEHDAASETVKFDGNLMSLVVDYLSSGGSSEELKSNNFDFDALFNNIAEFEQAAVGNAARLDTCCRVYHLLHKRDAAVRCGKLLEELLKDENSLKVSYSSEAIAYIKETLALIRGMS
jgi:ppGpp synthetase/RelA/SpoT-type nucleotidyltranferase